MAASVSYRINGKYDGKAVSQAQKSMAGLTQTAKTLKGALGALGVVAGVKALVNQFKDASKVFKENNTNQTQLFNALSNNAKTAKGNIAGLVKELDSMSGVFSGADIVKGGTLLASMGLDEDQIRATTKAAKDLASSGLMTLDQAFEALGKSYGGNATQLKKLFPELQNLTKEELEAGKAVEKLGQKFNGMENALSGTFQGQMSILKDKVDQIKDTMGAISGFLMQDSFEDFSKILDRLKDVADTIMPSIAAWASTIIHTFANFDIAKIFDPKTTFEAWKTMFQLMAKNFLAVFDSLKSKITGVWNQKQMEQNQIMLADMKRGYAEYANKSNLSSLELESLRNLKESITEMEDAIAEQQDLMKIKGKSLAELMSDMVVTTGDGLKDLASLYTGEDMSKYYDDAKKRFSSYKETSFSAGSGGGTGSSVVPVEVVEDDTNNNPIINNEEVVGRPIRDAFLSAAGDVGKIISSFIEGSPIGLVVELISRSVSVLAERSTIVAEFLNFFDNLLGQIFNPQVINFFNSTLGPLNDAIQSIGRSVANTIAPLLETLTPVFMIIAKSIDFVARVNETISAICYNIYAAVYNSFNLWGKKSYKDVGAVWDGFANFDYSYGTVNSNAGSSSSASYNAARDVYITINYSNSYVNGDARDIAINLYNEFKSAERMGYIS